MLGLWGAAALVTSGMIGGGVLLLPAKLGVFGAWSIVGIILTSCMAFSIAVLFGNLSRSFKNSSGPVDYVAKVFGNNAGFLMAWGYFFAMSASGACIAITLGDYLQPLIGIAFLTPQIIAILVLMSLFLLNMLSSGAANGMLIVLTVIKVVFFLGLGAFSFQYAGNYTPTFGAYTDILKTSSIAMFAFLGVEFASLSSSSMKDPEAHIMKATAIGVFIASLVVLVLHCAVLFTIPDATVHSRPVYEASKIILGSFGAHMLSFVAIISCLSTLSGILSVESSMVKVAVDKKWISSSLGSVTEQNFAWKGAALFCAVCVIIMNNAQLMRDALLCANALVGMVYLLSCLVDMKINGIKVYNILALISSFIILVNINLTVFLFVCIIYSVGFIVKKINSAFDKELV